MLPMQVLISLPIFWHVLIERLIHILFANIVNRLLTEDLLYACNCVCTYWTAFTYWVVLSFMLINE